MFLTEQKQLYESFWGAFKLPIHSISVRHEGQFSKILKSAGVRRGQFHDLRRTALSNWFASGMSEHDVMTLAGHSSFSTTHEFYLAVADDLIDRARKASIQRLGKNLARIWHTPLLSVKKG